MQKMSDNHETQLIGDILDETDDEYFGNLDFERVRQGLNRNGTKSAPPAFVDVLDSHAMPQSPAPIEDVDAWRASAEYYTYYYSHRPLDHRLPPPTFQPQWNGRLNPATKSWDDPSKGGRQQQQEVYGGVDPSAAAFHASQGAEYDFNPDGGRGGPEAWEDAESLMKRKGVVQMIQEDFPRTPSPIFNLSKKAQNRLQQQLLQLQQTQEELQNGVENRSHMSQEEIANAIENIRRVQQLQLLQQHQLMQQHAAVLQAMQPSTFSSAASLHHLQQQQQQHALQMQMIQQHNLQLQLLQQKQQQELEAYNEALQQMTQVSISTSTPTGQVSATSRPFNSKAAGALSSYPLYGLGNGASSTFAPFNSKETGFANGLLGGAISSSMRTRDGGYGGVSLADAYGSDSYAAFTGQNQAYSAWDDSPHDLRKAQQAYQRQNKGGWGGGGGSGMNLNGWGSQQVERGRSLKAHFASQQSQRSGLLEEFRNNKNRKFELSDIVGHALEFSQDQHGSRFIQTKLETASEDEKEKIFEELLPSVHKQMTDVFGNYVVQKFLEFGSAQQRLILARKMHGNVLALTLHLYGCRILQKALEVLPAEEQSVLIDELRDHVMRCVKDSNGNHVIQKAIERSDAKNIQFIVDHFVGQVVQLATHPYGCRVIQRILEHCNPVQMAPILREIVEHTPDLVLDQFGNYVTQHVLEHGRPEDRSAIIKQIKGRVFQLSQHKFASNVVEKCFEYAPEDELPGLVAELMIDDGTGILPVHHLARNDYGNYVIQRSLDVCTGKTLDLLVNCIKEQLPALRKFVHAKHVIAYIEKMGQSSQVRGTMPSRQHQQQMDSRHMDQRHMERHMDHRHMDHRHMDQGRYSDRHMGDFRQNFHHDGFHHR